MALSLEPDRKIAALGLPPDHPKVSRPPRDAAVKAVRTRSDRIRNR